MSLFVCAEKVQIGDLFYEFDEDNKTAKVVKDDSYKTLVNFAVVVPDKVEHNNETYPVTRIGNEAFKGCENIVSVTLGANIAYLETMSFYGCKNIETFTCNAISPPKVQGLVFNNVPRSQIPLTVPSQSLEAYRSETEWKKFILPEPIQMCTITLVTEDGSMGKIEWKKKND